MRNFFRTTITLAVYLVGFSWYTFLTCISYEKITKLSPSEAYEIGQKIWKNECGCSKDYLTWWGKGEEFASLGIGHFIWFPKNYRGPFTQTFPSLLNFFKQHKIELPLWLTKTTACPWPSREDFLKNKNHPKMVELRELLSRTIAIQTKFLIKRLDVSLPKLLTATPREKQAHIKKQFNRMMLSKNGIYALIDYLNFKGEGTSLQESYNSHGWGLLQVLEKMNGQLPGKQALQEFTQTAQKLLETRVHNAPPERNEIRWLPGWINRVNTYLQ